MKALEVANGTRITDGKYRYKRGKINSNVVPDNDEAVLVEWDQWGPRRIEQVNINLLRIIATPLQNDFDKVREQLNIAISAIKAADAVARAKGSSLEEWDRESILSSEDLLRALDSAGWQTSAMTAEC